MIAFMPDTTNVMKGVQKLIKREKPHLYDAGCICHLADLCVKAGMAALPVDIDQLFINYLLTSIFTFNTAAKEINSFFLYVVFLLY